MENSLVVINDSNNGSCGAIVWWSLSGQLRLSDLYETLEGAMLPEDIRPKAPSAEQAVLRAVESTCTPVQELVTVKKRRIWEVETRRVVSDAGAKHDTVAHDKTLRIVLGEDGKYSIAPWAADDVDAELQAETASSRVAEYGEILLASDVSSWLIGTIAPKCLAVSLRQTGGFYFIPRDRVDLWREATAALESCSAHRVSFLPALQNEDATRTILAAVEAEASSLFAQFDEYLLGECSTRGLNSIERQLQAQAEKLDAYSKLLGQAMSGLDVNIQNLRAAVTAARLVGSKE
jgi:hypothetical protein